jgi:hypothetical protein
VRVHHFERQLASPFPLLSAIAAKTSRKTEIFLAAIGGAAVTRTDPARSGLSGGLAIQPQSPGLAERIWWGSGTRATAQRAGYNARILATITRHIAPAIGGNR